MYTVHGDDSEERLQVSENHHPILDIGVGYRYSMSNISQIGVLDTDI